jgi:hypothetical protein
MSDFLAMVHFRALPGSQLAADGFRGGYGWHLGRASSSADFYLKIEAELAAQHLAVVEYEHAQEISSPDDLGSDEQRELFSQLDFYPIQYRTIHSYRDDDA